MSPDAQRTSGSYRHDRGLQHFVALFFELAGRFRLCLHAFVPVDNRYHLLAGLTVGNLSRV